MHSAYYSNYNLIINSNLSSINLLNLEFVNIEIKNKGLLGMLIEQ